MKETAAAKAAFRRLLFRSVFVPIVAMALLAIALIVQVNQLMRSANWLDHTDEVIKKLYRAKTIVLDAQVSVRGYILTGVEKDLDSFNEIERTFPGIMDDLRSYTSDRGSETGPLCDRIEKGRKVWTDYARSRIELRRSTGQIPPIVVDSVGRVAITDVRAAFDTWLEQENQLRTERNANTQRWAKATIFGAGVLTLGIGAILALLARGQLRWLSLTYEAALSRSRELSESLERRVDERTTELSSSNARLNDLNRELEAFSYSVSHDLRAPMRHISGFANLLSHSSESTLSADDKDNLDTIYRTAVLAGRMVDDLLAFSRIGRTQLRSDAVNMDAVIVTCRDELAPELAQRQIEWTVPPLPRAKGDSSLLKLAFSNLLSNAVKYTATRDVAHITLGSRSDEGGTTYFVKDDGVGFDMTYSHKLFGVFQRLHRAEEFEGTGIGLANVRRIILRHGGRVWAEGEPGVGATFYVFLPGSPTAS